MSRTSRAGFAHAGGNLLRVAVLLLSLFTLVLARGTAPISVLIGLVAITLSVLYLLDRKSGRFGLWAAYVAGFVLFALLRTIADNTGIPVKAQYVVDAERSLFGGVLPTQWLQASFHDIGAAGVAEVFVVAVVFSYYVVPHLLALVLWQRDPASFRRYCPAVLLTVYAGLVVSVLLPTAPPWLASRYSDAPPMSRVSADVLGWNPETMGADSSGAGLNPVAAMPSLHLAVTALIVIALWRRPVARAFALLYAAAMAFALVYGGEHYVVDELVGAATAALGWLAVTKVRLARNSSSHAVSPATSTVAPASRAD